MTSSQFLQIIYGVAIVLLLYAMAREYYSVYYVGGAAVYGSPVTQLLFPGSKMAPTWGYNSVGEYDSRNHPSTGPGDYWPEAGAGYVPKKNGSGGLSPSGGERGAGEVPLTEVEVGWWNTAAEHPVRTIQNVYEPREGIPEAKVFSVGHWSS